MANHKVNVKEYYESEAEDYNREFYLEDKKYAPLRYRHNYILKMVEALDLPAKAKILDVGCGPGEMIVDLIKADRELHGIDIAQEMIDIANNRLAKQLKGRKNKIELSVGDIENLNYPAGYFDLVICSGIVEYLEGDENWLREVSKVLVPNGYVIVNVTNKHSIKKWTTGILEPLKSSKLVFGMVSFFKEKVLGQGKVHHFPFSPRTHSPNGFDDLMKANGYEKRGHHYFDFAILPYPLDTVLSFAVIPLKKYLEKNYSQKNMTLNGTGYIGSYKKVK